VCCDTGRRSSAGAYILSERGFHASVLRDGLQATNIAKK
jgi:rhodanese-related sulfurtransferase